MAGIVYTKLLDALKGIGVDVTQQQGSNVKRLAPKNKSSATKVGLLAAERDTGGNFATVLDIFKDEAKYIDSMNDVEQMNFLNNILDYNEFGGKSINKASEGITGLEKNLEDLQSTAKTMKEDAEKSLAQSKKDLDDWLETGGQPFKKKDDKFLGGSMHEEGQLRTGIRQFLQSEYKNGRLKLNDLDKERIMQYSPMTEHDPILVFKRIYGDEAYKKAGSFPGAFEKGESFSHYEQIFRENMGEDLLKVKNKDYVGDGTLILTKDRVIPPSQGIEFRKNMSEYSDDFLQKKYDATGISSIRKAIKEELDRRNKPTIEGQDEVITPTPDDDVPFAKGGRASFAGGKLVDEILKVILKKEPIEAMKEVNKVIGKKGKYKNLTKKDIDRIVEGTDDWIMQRDPDNLYVYDDGKTVWDDDLTKEQLIEKESRAIDKADEMSLEDSLTKMEGLGATQTAERFRLKQKYPGITEDLLNKILIDDNPQRKAEVLATIDEAFRMMEKGKGTEEIIETFKNTSRTKNSTGGRAGYYIGGQATVEPDLSDIGHGSDSLMSRNRIMAPGSQATTSTGLNYLLGEDNDNTRVPFNDGLLVPPAKPYTKNMFEEDSMILLKGMYGTGKDSNKFLYNEMIKKGNKLREQGVDRETVIEIIRNNKDKINAFLETQTTTPKTFEGMAKGGRIGFAGGGADMGTVSGDTRKATAKSVNVSPSGQVTTSTTRGPDGPEDKAPPGSQQHQNHIDAMRNYQKPPESVVKNIYNTGQEFNYLRNLYKMDPVGLSIGYGINKFGPSIMEKLKNLRSQADIEDGIMRTANNDFTRFNFDDLTGMKPVNNSDYTQLAKVFNTKKDLQSIGAAKPSDFWDTLTPEGEALEKFRYDANKMENPTGTFKEYKGLGAESQLNTLLGNKNKNAIENEAFIRDALNQGFLADESDFLNQLPLGEAVDVRKAEGGIASLRPGYGGGSLVDKGRRGFLKWLGGTAAGVVALKAGLVKMLGKESGAVSKKVIDEVIIDGGSGAPAWLQPLVNKALREGTDKTKNLAYKDAQTVKSLDTPTGKVDVYYDVRTGEVEIDYIGGNTALGESVNMRYTPGMADEGTGAGGKPADEFEASEAIPEGKMTGPDDYNVEFGENVTSDVKSLYSDTSELAQLGGQKPLIKDISETIKKKKILKEMNKNPTEFANNNLPDFDN